MERKYTPYWPTESRLSSYTTTMLREFIWDVPDRNRGHYSMRRTSLSQVPWAERTTKLHELKSLLQQRLSNDVYIPTAIKIYRMSLCPSACSRHTMMQSFRRLHTEILMCSRIQRYRSTEVWRVCWNGGENWKLNKNRACKTLGWCEATLGLTILTVQYTKEHSGVAHILPYPLPNKIWRE